MTTAEQRPTEAPEKLVEHGQTLSSRSYRPKKAGQQFQDATSQLWLEEAISKKLVQVPPTELWDHVLLGTLSANRGTLAENAAITAIILIQATPQICSLGEEHHGHLLSPRMIRSGKLPLRSLTESLAPA